uniref:Putative site-specific DNA endonuclease n=1 Tax=Monomastix sp. (strain OKE-1) TaxID=141716 RepID=C0JWR3_MONSK|nr:putative site-specific DNA endonuclease [Monomastix sp. OKE-1]ACK36927.1 putative site-specific DNA endonuclease [Monomastix sp. OKE-1]
MSMHEQWITGFTDGEGCFHIGISKNNETKLGSQVLLEFVITQHQRDEQLLNEIKNYFGVGVVRKSNGRGDILCYRVRSQKHLRDVILPFFEKNILRTKKKFAFQRFKQALVLIENKEHLTLEGLDKLRKLRDQVDDSD